jgi:hypothetical protein
MESVVMKYLSFLITVVFLAFASDSVHADAASPEIVVNNRILTKVNGKAITLIDVVKKMDMLIFRHDSKLLKDQQTRYKFYQANWQGVLADMVDRELIMQEAEELKIPATQGDIRQEIEEIFGPNVMANLESANITFEEAWEMVRSDIMIRRMLLHRVSLPVMTKITPQDVRQAYDAYTKDISQHQEYSYRIISFKAEDTAKAEVVAKSAYKLLQEEKIPLEKIEAELKSRKMLCDGVAFTLSPLLTQKSDEIAEQIKTNIVPLSQNSYSEPLVQRTRSERAPLVRLYFLQNKTSTQPASFDELEVKLKESITQRRQMEETENYFTRLRKHFDVKFEDIQNELAQNFTPFVLK